jgi:DNA repair protein RecO (recombination protein O)
MRITCEGIVIHTTRYAENSIIARIYTRDRGLQTCIASAGTGKKAAARHLLQPLSLVQYTASLSPRAEMVRISDLGCFQPYQDLPYNIIKSTVGMFLCEVLHRSLKTDQPDEQLYEFLRSSLVILDLSIGALPDFHISFLLKLSGHLGFYPMGEYGAQSSYFDLQEGLFCSNVPATPHYLDPALADLLHRYLDAGYTDLPLLNVPKEQRRKLLNALITYFRLHIPSFGEIRSLSVLEEIIS